MNDFIDSVDKLCRQINNKTRYLNAGGCAVFASFMAQCLAHYGVVAIAVGCDGSNTSITATRNNVSSNTVGEWNDNGIYFNHVIVEFIYKGIKYHIDSSGVHPAKRYTQVGCFDIIDGRLTIQEVTDLAACKVGWNSMFNRGQIRSIKKMIDDGFVKIFNQGFRSTIG